MTFRGRLQILLCVCAALGGCDSASEPAGPPLTGSIVARDVDGPGAPTIHVKTTPSETCGVIYTVRGSTRILRRTATGHVGSASVSDLTVGRHVAVWADAIMDSCPGQATATTIELTELPD